MHNVGRPRFPALRPIRRFCFASRNLAQAKHTERLQTCLPVRLQTQLWEKFAQARNLLFEVLQDSRFAYLTKAENNGFFVCRHVPTMARITGAAERIILCQRSNPASDCDLRQAYPIPPSGPLAQKLPPYIAPFWGSFPPTLQLLAREGQVGTVTMFLLLQLLCNATNSTERRGHLYEPQPLFSMKHHQPGYSCPVLSARRPCGQTIKV